METNRHLCGRRWSRRRCELAALQVLCSPPFQRTLHRQMDTLSMHQDISFQRTLHRQMDTLSMHQGISCVCSYDTIPTRYILDGSVAEWLVCWTQAQKARVLIAAATLSVNSPRQTVHTDRASVHHTAKLVAAILMQCWTVTWPFSTSSSLSDER